MYIYLGECVSFLLKIFCFFFGYLLNFQCVLTVKSSKSKTPNIIFDIIYHIRRIRYGNRNILSHIHMNFGWFFINFPSSSVVSMYNFLLGNLFVYFIYSFTFLNKNDHKFWDLRFWDQNKNIHSLIRHFFKVFFLFIMLILSELWKWSIFFVNFCFKYLTVLQNESTVE